MANGRSAPRDARASIARVRRAPVACVHCAGRRRLRVARRWRIGLLDLSASLQPVHDHPAQDRPGRAADPACEHVGRPVDAEIDAACAHERGDQRRDADDEDPDARLTLRARKKRCEREVNRRRHHRVARREALRVDARAMGHEVGARACRRQT